MKSIRTMATVLCAVTAITAACSDADDAFGPIDPNLSANQSEGETPERAALNEITRAVALALQDPSLRQRVENDLRNLGQTFERKLEFTSYIKGESGGILLAKMAKETGRSSQGMLALLGAVRPLEFYVPVPEHRENWRGGADLLVASLLEDEKEATGRLHVERGACLAFRVRTPGHSGSRAGARGNPLLRTAQRAELRPRAAACGRRWRRGQFEHEQAGRTLHDVFLRRERR